MVDRKTQQETNTKRTGRRGKDVIMSYDVGKLRKALKTSGEVRKTEGMRRNRGREKERNAEFGLLSI